MTTFRSNSDERARQRQNILHNTQIFFYRLDQENMLERNCMAGYEVTTYRSVEARTIPYQACFRTGEFVQCGQSHMALFPLLKTARVASGENL
jgi:hypothetical protein